MEIEAKYRITGMVEPADIDGLDAAPYTLTYLGEDHIYDELVDTPERALAARGHALRRRRLGQSPGVLVTLKGGGQVSGAVHSRTEIEAEADPEAVAQGQWPEPIWADVRDLVNGDPLGVIVTVDNHRRLWRITRDGDEVAELALDSGRIQAGGLDEPFHELEIELKGNGSADDLQALEAALTARLPIAAEERSKFSRGLALLQLSQQRYKPLGLQRPNPATRPMLAVGREVILRNIDKLQAAEPIAREGSDPEGVHQLRVATRRLRAALQVLEETVADPKVTRRFRRGLRDLANSAGMVRDADVFLGHLDEYAGTVGEEEAAGLGPLRALLQERRRAGRKQMIKAIESKETRRLVKEIGRWAERGAGEGSRRTDEGPQPIWVRHFVRSAVWRRYEEILAYETVMPAPIPVLHRLRVAAKRMRYTVEFFEESLDTDGKWLLKRLSSVQDHLGILQDADVAIDAIAELARHHRGTAALQTYRDLRRRQQSELAESFTAVWHEFTGEPFRKRLSELLSGI